MPSNMTAAFTKAFETWETDFRAHPEKYMTAEQLAAAAGLDLAESRAVCFEAILTTLANGQPWQTIDDRTPGHLWSVPK